jgi:hypothetical protein
VRGLETTLSPDGLWHIGRLRPPADPRPFLKMSTFSWNELYVSFYDPREAVWSGRPTTWFLAPPYKLLASEDEPETERPAWMAIHASLPWGNLAAAMAGLRSQGVTELLFLAEEGRRLPVSWASVDEAAEAWHAGTVVRVAVGAEGDVAVNGAAAGPDALVARLREARGRSRGEGPGVALVSGEANAPFEAVLWAMEACGAAGLERSLLRVHVADEDVAAIGKAVLESGHRLVPAMGLPTRSRGKLALYPDSWFVIGPFATTPDPGGEDTRAKYLPERVYLEQPSWRPGLVSYLGRREKPVHWRWFQPAELPVRPTQRTEPTRPHVSPEDARRRRKIFMELYGNALDGAEAPSPKSDVGDPLAETADARGVWYAYTEIRSPDERTVRLALGAEGRGRCWVNRMKVWGGEDAEGPWRPDQAAPEVRLREGINPVFMRVDGPDGEVAVSAAVLLDAPQPD